MITARLARLSAPARELAGVAATIGREFSAPVLAGASDVDEQAFIAALDELWRRGIVRAHALDAYDFSHGRIRDVAYQALAPAERRRHHLRVAGALEQAHERDLDAAASLLAAQYDAAGATGDAVTWYVRAADAAQRLYDHAGSVVALERALTVCRELPVGAERDRRALEVLTALPAPLIALEGYRSPRLVGVHDQAIAVSEQLGVEPEAPLVRSLALAALTRGDFERARAFGDQLRAGTQREGDDVLWVESAWVLAVAAFWDGRLAPAREHFEAGLARLRPEHRTTHLLRYGHDPELVFTIRLAHTKWLLGDDDAGAHTRSGRRPRRRQRPPLQPRPRQPLRRRARARPARRATAANSPRGSRGARAWADRRAPSRRSPASSTCSTVAGRTASTASGESSATRTETTKVETSRARRASTACICASSSRRAP